MSARRPAKGHTRLNLDDLDLDPATTSDESGPSGDELLDQDAQARRDDDLRRQRPPHHGG